METDYEIAYYVIRWHVPLMTPIEKQAQTHLFGAMKATMGRSDVSAQQEAKKSKLFARWTSDNPDVLRLAADGYESFVTKTAARILHDSESEVLFNRCPKCNGLARTPTAKQCRFCGNDWH